MNLDEYKNFVENKRAMERIEAFIILSNAKKEKENTK